MKMVMNGDLVDSGQATVPAADRGFTLGDGLFETIKVKAGRPLRLDAHWQRLAAGAAVLRLALPLGRDGLVDAITRWLAANDLADAALRLTVSRGSGPRGLLPPDPTLPIWLLSGGPMPAAAGPARTVIAQTVRRNAHSPLARCKTLSYLDNVLARFEAAERGADEAILLNTDGRVAETTIANLFVVDAAGTLITPPVADGALPGIRRAELVGNAGAKERPIGPQTLLSAREVFMTNALSIRPVTAVDGIVIGDGGSGPRTREFMESMDRE